MFDKIIQNTRKPNGLGGKMILKMMNTGHNKLSEWGLSHLSLRASDHVLDVGCGGGANIAKLLKICTGGFVAGIDYSEESLKYSRKKNINNLDKNCIIKFGSASNIPFKDNSFDVVTAFETIYFWPNLKNDFQEIRRVLKPNGQFMICCEDGDPVNDKWSAKIEGMRVYSIEQLEGFLKDTGFSIIKADKKEGESWICITAENNM